MIFCTDDAVAERQLACALANLAATLDSMDAHVVRDRFVRVRNPEVMKGSRSRVHVKPEMGVEHTVNFEPLGGGRTAVAPDYALISSEINPVMSIMRRHSFAVHCLYNQETAETPQLYFSHQLAVGSQPLARSGNSSKSRFWPAGEGGLCCVGRQSLRQILSVCFNLGGQGRQELPQVNGNSSADCSQCEPQGDGVELAYRPG
jgi:hypothetical protein